MSIDLSGLAPLTEKEFKACRGNIMNNPRVMAYIAKAQEVNNEAVKKVEHSADLEEMIDEPIVPSFGKAKFIRPMSAGVVNVLIKLKSPFVVGEFPTDNMELIRAAGVVFYLLSAPDISAIIRDIHEGHEKFMRGYELWEFDYMDFTRMGEMVQMIEHMMAQINVNSIEGAGDEISNPK